MKITNAKDAYRCLQFLNHQHQEEVWAVALSGGKKVLAMEMVHRGTADQVPIFPRDIFRFGLRNNASTLLIAHNHPTGDPEPSPADIEVTRRLMAGGTVLQIPLVDHLVIGNHKFVSIREEILRDEFASI